MAELVIRGIVVQDSNQNERAIKELAVDRRLKRLGNGEVPEFNTLPWGWTTRSGDGNHKEWLRLVEGAVMSQRGQAEELINLRDKSGPALRAILNDLYNVEDEVHEYDDMDDDGN